MDGSPDSGIGAHTPQPPEGVVQASAASSGGSTPTLIQASPNVTPFIPKFVPRENLPAATAESMRQLDNILGFDVAATGTVVAMPSPEDKTLSAATTVEEAMPLIGNMLKAEKAAGAAPRKPYPRTALKHQHIVAFMLCNPFATTTEICSFFSISPTTLSNITKSDTFKSLIGAHRVSIESGIGADLQEQLRHTMAAAVEVVQKAVTDKQDPDYALEVLDKTANRLGLGAKHQSGVNVQVNVVTPEMIAAARASRRQP